MNGVTCNYKSFHVRMLKFNHTSEVLVDIPESGDISCYQLMSVIVHRKTQLSFSVSTEMYF